MPRSPIVNFICVISLLALMAGAVVMMTKAGNKSATEPSAEQKEVTIKTQVDVLVRMLFSHRPHHVVIHGHGVDTKPDANELEFTLRLPAETETDLPLDIQWAESGQAGKARYFTQITIRQDGKEDTVIVFADQYPEFADLFTIDTRNP